MSIVVAWRYYVKSIPRKVHDRYLIHRYIHPFTEKNRDRVLNPRNTCCLFSQPRGGSTWLSEILMHLPGACLIDEPLWRGRYRDIDAIPNSADRKVPELANLGFYFNQPIPPSAFWPDAHRVLKDILSGRVRSLGLYRSNFPAALLATEVYFVRVNFGHFLMRWLLQQFDVRAVAMLRHPCALIASQLRSRGFRDLNIKAHWQWPNFRYNDFYREQDHRFKKAASREEVLAVLWAMQAREVIRASAEHDVHVLHYEHLVLDYEAEIRKLLEHLGVDCDRDMLLQQRYRPSQSTLTDRRGLVPRHQQLTDWRLAMPASMQRRILSIVHEMGAGLYGTDPVPMRTVHEMDVP